MPLINERYPGGDKPLLRTLRNFAIAIVLGLIWAAFLVKCGGASKEHPPRHPVPASTRASR